MLCRIHEFACFIDMVVSGILVHVHGLYEVPHVLQRFGLMSDISAFCNDVPLRSASFVVCLLCCPFLFAFVFILQFQDFILATGRIMKRVC